MLITRLAADLLRVPLPRARTLPRADEPVSVAAPADAISVLLVQLATDAGLTGLGFGYVTAAGRAAVAAVEDELAPRLVGADPRLHQRLYSTMPVGIPRIARAAVDIAVWDLAAKAANLPLWQFLGGARESIAAYASETAGPWMNADQVIAAYEPLKDKGMTGLHVAVGGRSPEADARKLEEVRNHVGLDDWLGVTANGSYDAGTALAMGRFLEEEMDADWFEDPVPADDRAGLRRLADKLEVPVAAGSRFDRISDFTSWVTDAPAGVVRPDVLRLGGLTPTLQVIHVATALARPVVPMLLPEISVHLACGLNGVRAVDYVGWLEPLWKTPPTLADGKLTPPAGSGLGFEPDPAAVERYRIKA
ncbi:MAG TPA: mandelate racemase/muconate lactonizing enzyme family protein [Gemmataceae bacterium]|jgi:L-alanine-DL-glutamate epimerase-like enolase superfamily enzyme|nr:mandelate racemase/muconate lactonizing enzyme family protein [Gemmataceae bacterium]